MLEQKTNSSAGNSVRSSVRSGSVRDASQPPSGCTSTGTNTPSAMQTMLAVQKFNRSSKSGNMSETTTPYGLGQIQGSVSTAPYYHASAATSCANSRKSSFNSVGFSPHPHPNAMSVSISSINAAAVMAAAASARAAVSAAFPVVSVSSNDANDTDTKMTLDTSGVTTRNGSFSAGFTIPTITESSGPLSSILARSSGTATPNLHVQSFIQRTMPQTACHRLANASMAHLTRMGTNILQKSNQVVRKQIMTLTFNQKNQIIAITVKDI